MFSNHMYDKDLVSRTFKNSHNSATKRYKSSLKIGKDFNRHFYKEDIEMTDKHMERC